MVARDWFESARRRANSRRQLLVSGWRFGLAGWRPPRADALRRNIQRSRRKKSRPPGQVYGGAIRRSRSWRGAAWRGWRLWQQPPA